MSIRGDDNEMPPARPQERQKESRLQELRRLILEPEQDRLESLQQRLDNPEVHARELSRVLPRAVLLSAQKDSHLESALMPTVEKIVKASVKRDLNTFVDALFPVMGPAIRKAISEAFKQMMQSLNTALEQSFSWQGLKWRLESMRTGKPFAEVVMLHMLLYRVEQVFLIHKETGLLLQHVAAADMDIQDADLVSGMLTAIQDFVRDSFGTEHYQSLETAQVGEVTLWIEQGPQVILAVTIRGNAPHDLRDKFKAILETIHLEMQAEMEAFEGDNKPFELARPKLEACIELQLREKEKRVSPLLILLITGLMAGLGAWAVVAYRQNVHRNDYLDLLKSQTGIVITASEIKNGQLHIAGLRDPRAVDPAKLLLQSQLNPEKVIHRFKPYQALHPDLVLARSARLLDPPDSVTLKLDAGILSARGSAPYRWILRTRRLVPAISGVQGFDETALVNGDLDALAPPPTIRFTLHDGYLSARGKADLAWIKQTRKRAMKITGIVQYTDDEVDSHEADELASLQARLENVIFPFQVNTAGHTQDQLNDLQRIQRDVGRFIMLGLELGKKPYIEIVGHTDRSGTDQRNMALSLDRANRVKAVFVAKGTQSKYLVTRGAGWHEPVRDELTAADKALNRSITLQPYLNGPPGEGR